MLVHRLSNLTLSSKTIGHSLSIACTITAHSFFFFLLQVGDKCHSCYIFMKAVEESEGNFERNRRIIIVQKQEKP